MSENSRSNVHFSNDEIYNLLNYLSNNPDNPDIGLLNNPDNPDIDLSNNPDNPNNPDIHLSNTEMNNIFQYILDLEDENYILKNSRNNSFNINNSSNFDFFRYQESQESQPSQESQISNSQIIEGNEIRYPDLSEPLANENDEIDDKYYENNSLYPKNFTFNINDDNVGDNSEKLDHLIGPYYKIEKLGEGSFGMVFKVININTLEYKVIKKVISIEQSFRELEINRIIKEHCINYFSCFESYIKDDIYLYIIFEYLENYISLNEAINGKYLYDLLGDVSDGILKKLFNNLCIGIKTLHKLDIAHLDIKPDNILINIFNKDKIKYIDFGLSCIKNQCNSNLGFTKEYRDPLLWSSDIDIDLYSNLEEFIDPSSLNETQLEKVMQGDLWSIGCIIYKIIVGSTPYENYKSLLENDDDFQEKLMGIRSKRMKKINYRNPYYDNIYNDLYYLEYIDNYEYEYDPNKTDIDGFLIHIGSNINMNNLFSRTEKRIYYA